MATLEGTKGQFFGLAGVIGHFSDLSYWHATTKTYAYFGGFGFFRVFFRQKSDPTMVKSHFKNTMRNPFFKAPFF